MKTTLLILILILSGCSDVITNSYKTYHEAKKDKLFARGWLPDILPKSTKNIISKNNLDLNISSGSFSIPVKDINKFILKINKIENNKYQYQKIPNGVIWLFTVNNQNGYIAYVLK